MEMNVFSLPEYEVVIHIIVSKFSENLAKEIKSISMEFDPYDVHFSLKIFRCMKFSKGYF